jgi:glycosyltransferase involved in cell wall biosynthesis
VITTNYNSKPYLPIAELSLYSVFKAIIEINKQNEYRILLVDSASTDGSFEELCELGEKLSMETKISFETIQLRKDLGNSFAYAYGFLYSRNEGADYIVYMDNDFIIQTREHYWECKN